MSLPFMGPDGRLKSYDILKWAVDRGPFILRGVVDAFSDQLSKKINKDRESLAHKDASERLRKLLKSGMIMVVAVDSLKSLTRPYKSQVKRRNEKTGKWEKTVIVVEPLLTEEKAQEYNNEIGELGTVKGRGRKPRVYLATRKGRQYVEFREKYPLEGRPGPEESEDA